jgi:hypothetical protein
MKRWLPSLLVLLFATPCFATYATIITTTLPNGIVGKPYSAVIQAKGGCTPYVWGIASGKLPAGITAKRSTATTSLNLAGTPKTAAKYSFTAQVAGCNKHISRVLFKIAVQAAENHIVDLNWKASTSKNVAGYNIYRAPDRTTWKKVNAGLIATAVDINGHESKKTALVKAVIP